MTRALSLAFAGSFLVVTLGCEVTPTNAYDPDTPEDSQAAGSLSGKVQAVTELLEGEIVDGVPAEGESLLEAAFCAPAKGITAASRWWCESSPQGRAAPLAWDAPRTPPRAASSCSRTSARAATPSRCCAGASACRRRAPSGRGHLHRQPGARGGRRVRRELHDDDGVGG